MNHQTEDQADNDILDQTTVVNTLVLVQPPGPVAPSETSTPAGYEDPDGYNAFDMDRLQEEKAAATQRKLESENKRLTHQARMTEERLRREKAELEVDTLRRALDMKQKADDRVDEARAETRRVRADTIDKLGGGLAAMVAAGTGTMMTQRRHTLEVDRPLAHLTTIGPPLAPTPPFPGHRRRNTLDAPEHPRSPVGRFPDVHTFPVSPPSLSPITEPRPTTHPPSPPVRSQTHISTIVDVGEDDDHTSTDTFTGFSPHNYHTQHPTNWPTRSPSSSNDDQVASTTTLPRQLRPTAAACSRFVLLTALLICAVGVMLIWTQDRVAPPVNITSQNKTTTTNNDNNFYTVVGGTNVTTTNTREIRILDGANRTDIFYISTNTGVVDTALGRVVGRGVRSVFGAVATVHSSNVATGIWGIDGQFQWATSAVPLVAQSTRVQDTATGVGAQTVRVCGLDASLSAICDTITLQGTSVSADTAQRFLHVNNATVTRTGVATVPTSNYGDITVRGGGGSPVFGVITGQGTVGTAAYGYGVMQNARFTVPLDQRVVLTRLSCHSKRNTPEADLWLYRWRVGESRTLLWHHRGMAGDLVERFEAPFVLEVGTTVWAETATLAGSAVSCAMEMEVIY